MLSRSLRPDVFYRDHRDDLSRRLISLWLRRICSFVLFRSFASPFDKRSPELTPKAQGYAQDGHAVLSWAAPALEVTIVFFFRTPKEIPVSSSARHKAWRAGSRNVFCWDEVENYT